MHQNFFHDVKNAGFTEYNKGVFYLLNFGIKKYTTSGMRELSGLKTTFALYPYYINYEMYFSTDIETEHNLNCKFSNIGD